MNRQQGRPIESSKEKPGKRAHEEAIASDSLRTRPGGNATACVATAKLRYTIVERLPTRPQDVCTEPAREIHVKRLHVHFCHALALTGFAACSWINRRGRMVSGLLGIHSPDSKKLRHDQIIELEFASVADRETNEGNQRLKGSEATLCGSRQLAAHWPVTGVSAPSVHWAPLSAPTAAFSRRTAPEIPDPTRSRALEATTRPAPQPMDTQSA